MDAATPGLWEVSGVAVGLERVWGDDIYGKNH